MLASSSLHFQSFGAVSLQTTTGGFQAVLLKARNMYHLDSASSQKLNPFALNIIRRFLYSL